MVIAKKARQDTPELVIPPELPILPSGKTVIYPSLVIPMSVKEPAVVRLIDDAVSGEKIIGMFAQRVEDSQSPEDLYPVGTAVLVARMLKWPDGSTQAFLQGLARIRLDEVTETKPYLKGKVHVIAEQAEDTPEREALKRNLLTQFQRIVELAPNLPEETSAVAMNISDAGSLADFVASHINLTLEESQEILELFDVTERINKLNVYLTREMELLELGRKLQSQIKTQMDKAQREFYLREQLKAIQKELGESDGQSAEVGDLTRQLQEAQLPAEAQKEAERELDRLSKMHPSSAEYTVSRTYLDWLLSLPWHTETPDCLSVEVAAKVLDEDHYDLEKVKQRILDYLAVRTLKEDMRGPILCFVGPPGTGKTSVGQSIARALGRKFARMSLGGVRDEADIRGHRRTYVGAMPGRVIQGLRRAGSKNPVFMLDEIDKVGADYRGDPSSALLEVLDPAQNNAFVDHYLDVPFDFSRVLFLATANMTDTIHPALLDRMEVIELPGYIEQEKLHIAQRYIVPRQLRENGLKAEQLTISDEAILGIVRSYTREAGVRNLEREIGSICRKTARQIVTGATGHVTVTEQMLSQFLGSRRFQYELAGKEDEVGIATGLAWTPTGGDVLFVEASPMAGKGNLTLTGKLGDVMQESARAAYTYARSRASSMGIDPHFYENTDIHIHVPAGAIPKDGPSAGVTMAVALISALSRRPVSKEFAMTGEITLRGKVLPVGGIKNKVLAAHRAGIRKIILPKDNENDLEEIPEHIRKELEFILAENLETALAAAIKSLPLPNC